MLPPIYSNLLFGELGAFVVLAFTALRSRARGKIESPLVLAGTLVFAGLGTVYFFGLVAKEETQVVLRVHYGAFLALAGLELWPMLTQMAEKLLRPPDDRTPTTAAFGAVLTAAPTAAKAPMILNGFFPVFGVASLGAFFSELYRYRSTRLVVNRKNLVISALVIVTSGVITTLYGTTDINAPLALQLGASGPLLVKRMK